MRRRVLLLKMCGVDMDFRPELRLPFLSTFLTANTIIRDDKVVFDFDEIERRERFFNSLRGNSPKKEIKQEHEVIVEPV